MATDKHDPNSLLPGILRLSPETRRRIYLLVGLGPWRFYEHCEPHVYNLAEHNDDKRRPAEMRRWCQKEPKLFFGLLVSCKTIYSEASALLYSTNSFVLYYGSNRLFGLGPLLALNPGSIAALTNLKVILNQASCHCTIFCSGGDCCDRRRMYEIYWPVDDSESKRNCEERHLHDLPVEASNPLTQALLQEWQAAAAHLAAHITPGQLEFSLVCDFDVGDGDVEAAKQVVDALARFPRLKNCHIRLSRTRDLRLRELAEQTVLRSRGLVSEGSPPLLSPSLTGPRLINLPRELRLRILEYTDLVTPLKEVMWTRAHGKYLAVRPSCPEWDGRGEHSGNPRIHHGCQFSVCSLSPWPKNSLGCFCAREHAAVSSTCRCWAPPTALFLVCRTLREDAGMVFVSKNRFAVMEGERLQPFGPAQPSPYERHSRLAVSQFLRGVVPVDCLRHLRFVEMVFPPFIPGGWPVASGWPDADHPALVDWSDTVAWVKDKINAPGLTLRVVAKYDGDMDTTTPSELTEDQAEETMESYLRVLQPLAALSGADGLAGFYADLTWPWRRTRAMHQRRREQWQETCALLEEKERLLKEQAERLVLGERYDRQRARDDEPERGAWYVLFERDY